MNLDDIKRLRELAGKATQGEWKTYTGNGWVNIFVVDSSNKTICDVKVGYPQTLAESNSSFIAAANPSTITALCDLAERALEQDAQPSETVDGAVFNEKLSDACDAWMGDEGKFTDAYNDLVDSINAWQRSVTAKAAADALAGQSLESIEQYRMQMAGISTAALGFWKESEGIKPEYDTLALRDVARLYAKYDVLYKAAAFVRLEDKRREFEEWATGCSLSIARLGDGYESAYTDCAWNGWQARALPYASSAAGQMKPNADCSGDPKCCPDNEGNGCACDPLNKAALTQPNKE